MATEPHPAGAAGSSTAGAQHLGGLVLDGSSAAYLTACEACLGFDLGGAHAMTSCEPGASSRGQRVGSTDSTTSSGSAAQNNAGAAAGARANGGAGSDGDSSNTAAMDVDAAGACACTTAANNGCTALAAALPVCYPRLRSLTLIASDPSLVSSWAPLLQPSVLPALTQLTLVTPNDAPVVLPGREGLPRLPALQRVVVRGAGVVWSQ